MELRELTSEGATVACASLAEEMEIVVVMSGGGKFGDMGELTAVVLPVFL